MARKKKFNLTKAQDASPKITKIIANRNGVTLEWYTTEEAEDVTHKLHCSDAPHPSFTNTWRGFVRHVVEILELAPDYLQGLTVTALSIKHLGDAEHRHHGLTISFRKDLGKTGTAFNATTPYVTGSENAEVSRMSAELQIQVSQMLDEAHKYRMGNRLKAQPDMFEASAGIEKGLSDE